MVQVSVTTIMSADARMTVCGMCVHGVSAPAMRKSRTREIALHTPSKRTGAGSGVRAHRCCGRAATAARRP